MKLKTFRIGGVHPEENKLTSNCPTQVAPLPKQAIFPLSQHIGAPAKPVVSKGDKVRVGTLLAEAGGFVSAPIHSSVSGTVLKIDTAVDATGYRKPVIVVSVEGDEWEESIDRSDKLETLDAHPELTPEEIVERVKQAGITGMGGAGFPTHVKLSPSDPEKIDYVLVNGSECEPYVTCDYKLLCIRPGELIAGLKAVLKLFGNVQGVICIEDNKPDAISTLKKALIREETIYVAPCRTKYPEGAERSLIKAITHRDVNSMMLPADAGCIVVNVSTIYAIFEAVYLGKPDYARLITVSGDAIVSPGNFLVPNGMYFREIIHSAGGFRLPPEKLIAGGPMMGFAQADLEGVTTKTSSAITAFCYDIISAQPETPCINCGRCADACPARLVPSHLARMVEKGKMDQFEENYGLECVNCGSCSWSCPAKRPLAALIFQGRQMVLAQRRKARK